MNTITQILQFFTIESAIIFILGIVVGVIGCIKLIKPSSPSSAVSPPPVRQAAVVVERKSSVKSTQREGKRKTVSILTAKEKYRAITRAKLPSKRVLNGEEKIIFRAVEEFIARWNLNKDKPHNTRGLIVLAQVSIGEFIGPSRLSDDATKDERDAWFALQARRADFLIVDRYFKPVLVIEHQGSGHFKGDWKDRDKDKMTAYTYAQIPVAQTYAGVGDSSVNHVQDPERVARLIASKLNNKYNLKASSDW